MSQNQAELQLKLLGKPQVMVGGAAIVGFRTAKSEALLYYLAVTAKPHSREVLANLLWGDMPENKAKRNLTKALSHLRKDFAPYLLIEPDTISLNPEADVWLDVSTFEVSVKDGLANGKLTVMTEAVDWYEAEFLAGFHVKKAYPFEEWVLTERERLRALMLQVLQTIVGEAVHQAAFDEGLMYAQRLLTLEPWHELAHRQMMWLLALNGRREAALEQYQTCCDVLDEELGVEPMAETTALYERLLATGTTPPNNIPPPPNAFVGRDTELQQIMAHLADPACRLLSIVGAGGIGKTRLAIEAARHYLQANQLILVPDFSNGVYVVSLVSIATGQDAVPGRSQTSLSNALIAAIADAIGFAFHGTSDMRGQLLTYLAPKSMLLVLDNFEQFISDGATPTGLDLVVDILQQAPQVKLLLTSRERLNLQEESVIDVLGLGYPTESDAWPLVSALDGPNDVNQPYSALALFVQRAQQAFASFTLTKTDLPHIVQICQLVEGLPLGLELAASWLRALTCAEIAAEIQQSLNFLETAWRNVPERHRSMRAVFDRSWQMLSPQEQTVLSHLSVFRGGFRYAAAKQVSGVSLSMLSGLVDKSMVRWQADRYDMHELLRQYAAEKLLMAQSQEQTDNQAVWQRHSSYYLDFVGSLAGQLQADDPQATVAKMRVEFDNIRQAWHWALINYLFEPLNQSIDALVTFYELTGLFDEAQHLFGRAADQLMALKQADDLVVQDIICHLLASEIEFAEMRGDHDLAKNRASQIIERATQPHASRYVADAKRILGILARGDFEQAQAHLNDAIPIYQALDEQRRLAFVYDWLGLIVSDHRLLDQALTYLQQGQQLHQRASNARGQIFNLGMTATVYSVMGRLEDALTTQQTVLQQYTQQDYQLGIARTANNVGVLAHELGDYEAAVQHFDDAIHLAHQIGSPSTKYNALGNKGESLVALGEYEQAQHCYLQALAHFQAVDLPWREVEIQWRLGQLYLYRGAYVEAQRALDLSLSLPGAEDDPESMAFAHGLLGMLHHQQGAQTQALTHFDLAISLFPQARRLLTLATLAHLPKATLLLTQAEIAGAKALLCEVEPLLAQQIGHHPIQFEYRLLLAQVTVACGNQAQAQQQLEDLLVDTERSAEQAAIHYELWQLEKDAYKNGATSPHGEAAFRLYADCIIKTPAAIYRTRYDTLQGHGFV